MPESIIKTIPAPYLNGRGLCRVDNYLFGVYGTYNRIVQIDFSGNVLNDWPSPSTGPRGLTWDGKNFWYSDSVDIAIYKLDRRMNVVDGFRSPFTSPRALAWDGEHVWVCEFGSLNRAILFHPEDYMLHQIMDMVRTDINGLVHVGNFIYFLDVTTAKLYKRNKTGLDILNYSVTAAAPRGLTSDDQYLYLADSAALLIYVLAL